LTEVKNKHLWHSVTQWLPSESIIMGWMETY